MENEQVKNKNNKIWVYVFFFLGIGMILGGAVYYILNVSTNST